MPGRVEARLAELGLELPEVVAPLAAYGMYGDDEYAVPAAGVVAGIGERSSRVMARARRAVGPIGAGVDA